MKKIYPWVLLVLGSALEIYYYCFRFSKDGVHIVVSLIIAISLTVLLTLASTFFYKKISWLLIIPLAIFSIISTSSGQSFSLGEVRDQQIENISKEFIRNDEIQEIQKEINYLNIEFENLSSQVLVDDIDERWKYSGVISRAEERKDKIREEKKELQSRLSDLRLQQTTHENVTIESETDIYIFYNKLFGIDVRWSQFFLQTVLSFFIAIMAPIGLVLINNKKPLPVPEKNPEQNPVKETKQQIDLDDEKIKRFVTISWAWKRSGKENQIVTYEKFQQCHDNRILRGKEEKQYTKEEWYLLFNILLEKNLVDNDGIILYTGQESRVVNLIKNKLRGRKL